MLKQKFIQYLAVEKGYSRHTLQAYLLDLDQLHEFLIEKASLDVFEEQDLSSIDPKLLRKWIGHLTEAGLAPRSLSRKVSSVKTYFRFLNLSQISAHNPASGLQLRKVPKKLPSFLKESEVETLFEQLTFPETFEGYRDKCILEVLYGCGLRRSELIELQTENINLMGRQLRVMGKNQRERIIPFSYPVQKSLIQYVAFLRAKGIDNRHHFFVRKDGSPLYPKLVYRIVQKYLTLSSEVSQKSPHTLRHTFATHLLDRGADLNAIKELLGHKSLAATQVYTHNSIQKLRSVHKQAHPRSENT